MHLIRVYLYELYHGFHSYEFQLAYLVPCVCQIQLQQEKSPLKRRKTQVFKTGIILVIDCQITKKKVIR
jgi:hypothetical protein